MVVLILIITYVAYDIYWHRFSWNPIATADQMQWNRSELLQVKPQPDLFYTVLDSLYPGHRSTSMTEGVARIILAEISDKVELKKCKCYDIGYLAWNNDSAHFEFNFPELMKSYWSFGYGLEHYSSPEACFEYWLNYDLYFEYRYLSDFNELSLVVLGQSVNELSKEEMIELVNFRMNELH